jgi:hypothetical protein
VKKIYYFLWLICINVWISSAHASDHNEPDLLSIFFADRSGSGADIYGLFAYPTVDGQALNLIMTLAAIPSPGVFDGNSVQRIYLLPGTVPGLGDLQVLKDLAQHPNPSSFGGYVKKLLSDPGGILSGIAGQGNKIPANQDSIPEVRISYSKDGKWAKVEFINFLDTKFPVVIAKSNGPELQENQLITYQSGTERIMPLIGGIPQTPGLVPDPGSATNSIKVFVGGRDDPFFADVGGFLRSVNFAAAIVPDNNYQFTWKGKISYLASAAEKELGRRAKHLVEPDERKSVLYNGVDGRMGQNANAICLQIPLKRIVKDLVKNRVLYTWAESFLTKEGHKKLAPPTWKAPQ